MRLKTLTFFLIAAFTVACQTTASLSQQTRKPATQMSSSVFRVGMISDAIALDPHYMFSDLNFQVSKMIYDPLFEFGPNKEIVPLLALDGRQFEKDPTIWVFNLKPNVKFHNGQAFTKADVICTFDRMEAYAPHSPSGFFKNNLGAVDLQRTRALNKSKGGPLRLLIATKEPGPNGKPASYKLLPSNLASNFIMSCDDTKRAMKVDKEDATASDKSPATLAAFANGLFDGPNGSLIPLLNGTGPYRFKSWVPLTSQKPNPMIEFEKFENYHGRQRAWDKVQMIPVPNGDERVDRLLKGDLDFIASVPAPRFKQLKELSKDSNYPFVTFESTSLRMVHMQMYQTPDGRENDSRHIPLRTEDGRVMPTPFTNFLVRKAFAQAIDKNFLVGDVMGDLAVATSQYMPVGTVGHMEKYPSTMFDIAEARKTLQAAAATPGYEFLKKEKLVLTIQGPSDRYPNAARTLQELAAMWTRAFQFVGTDGTEYSIRVEALLEPSATYFGNGRKYLVHLIGGGVDNGHVSGAVRLYFLSDSALNEGSYKNQEVDSLYRQGVTETETSKSDQLLTQALEKALDDFAILPMYNQKGLWAGKRGLSFKPRLDEATVPDQISLEITK